MGLHAPPNAAHIKIMCVLVKQTRVHSPVAALDASIAEACNMLKERGA